MSNCLLMIVVNICFCSSCRHTNELDELNSPSNTGNLSIAVVYYTCLSVVIYNLAMTSCVYLSSWKTTSFLTQTEQVEQQLKLIIKVCIF